MKSLDVGTFLGIPVKVHWTFSLLLLFFLGYGFYLGADWMALLSLSSFILLMFVCVILHEYGHALAARRYGIQTLDIIISPIGGIARLQNLPNKPIQELIVAIAGPLVNLGIALLLFGITLTFLSETYIPTPDDAIELLATPYGFLVSLIYINSILFVFNLIPAFPMDGGRILRAFLSMKYGKVKGTNIASIVGRTIAVGFIILGLYSQNVVLVLIGGFVFIMARSENEQVIIQSKLALFNASQIVNSNYSRIHLSDPIAKVYEQYIRGGEKNYLVFDSLGNISGVFPDLFIKKAFKSNDLDKPVSNYMSTSIYEADIQMPLDELYKVMNRDGIAIAIIKNGDQLQGVIDRQMIHHFIQLQLFK